ncbi:MAG: 4-(cytidine 5'-diphospho)-2-C-methyl-D-erythritol kinase, partial [Thermodesulfobacteriota bacterium]|nr:4-(cytidine 5'-diphospho)-2-C-methyl-D-erythritol kinase [Thermodesulfobacteriota bacterium]
VLLGLNKLLGLRLSKNELIKLGAELGSDVPFFIFGNCSFVTGRGEVLQKLCLKRGAFLILVNPGIAISTKSVYDSVNIKLTKKRNHISMTPPLFDLYENLHVLSNDLETVVRRQYSQISDIKDQLMKLGALAVQLSGSGSTVYGVFPTWIDAKTALSQLETVTSYDSFLVYTL